MNADDWVASDPNISAPPAKARLFARVHGRNLVEIEDRFTELGAALFGHDVWRIDSILVCHAVGDTGYTGNPDLGGPTAQFVADCWGVAR